MIRANSRPQMMPTIASALPNSHRQSVGPPTAACLSHSGASSGVPAGIWGDHSPVSKPCHIWVADGRPLMTPNNASIRPAHHWPVSEFPIRQPVFHVAGHHPAGRKSKHDAVIRHLYTTRQEPLALDTPERLSPAQKTPLAIRRLPLHQYVSHVANWEFMPACAR